MQCEVVYHAKHRDVKAAVEENKAARLGRALMSVQELMLTSMLSSSIEMDWPSGVVPTTKLCGIVHLESVKSDTLSANTPAQLTV